MECATTNRSNTIADCYTCQRGATIECIIYNRSNAIRNCDTCHTTTTCKSVTTNRSNAIWDSYTCQRGAIPECAFSNFCHPVRNDYLRKMSRISKCPIPYLGKFLIKLNNTLTINIGVRQTFCTKIISYTNFTVIRQIPNLVFRHSLRIQLIVLYSRHHFVDFRGIFTIETNMPFQHLTIAINQQVAWNQIIEMPGRVIF